MMTIVVVVTVIGLQAVGLILVVALLIIPAAAARFWTFNLRHMLWLSGLFGALSGMLGAGISALMANLPAGAVIVLTASVLFVFSMALGSARGLLRMVRDRMALQRRIRQENLLRDLYEWFEGAPHGWQGPGPHPQDLQGRRSWSQRQLALALQRLIREGSLNSDADQRLTFSAKGLALAKAVVRKHRLWEAYLLTHADVATGMVDLSADRIEHVLDDDIIKQLEQLFPQISGQEPPASPHALPSVQGAV
jgi:manganese/zinc/iron transport system permease protein